MKIGEDSMRIRIITLGLILIPFFGSSTVYAMPIDKSQTSTAIEQQKNPTHSLELAKSQGEDSANDDGGCTG